MKRYTVLFLLIFPIVSAVPLFSGWAAEDVYMPPDVFIEQSFEGTAPKAQTLTIDEEALRGKVSTIMGSHYDLSSVEYYERDGRTGWILDAIGKYEPITAGFIVGPGDRLERVKVLIYRESHGWEVKHNFFTRQFKGAGLKKGRKLDQRIDGISGATLSVKALKRLSALALMLHREVSSSP